MVPVNYLAIVAAAIAAMIIGWLWYGPVFGKTWMRLMGWTSIPKVNLSPATAYGLGFVGALVQAFVLAHALVFASAYLEVTGISAGLQGAFWNWLGFVAPVTMGMWLWEGKSWKLWVLTAAYYLVTLSAMGMILSLWQ